MIGVFSFFLALFSYLLILIFFYYSFTFHKKDKKKEVLIHTAIVLESKKKIKSIKNISVKKSLKVEKEVNKKNVKIGSKSNFTKGGEVDFKDIFKTVKEDINSSKVNLQKSINMSRYKGNFFKKIEKNLEDVRNLNVDIFYKNKGSSLDKKEFDKIVKKVTHIWYNTSNIAGEYAKVHIISKNNKVYVTILDSNLDVQKQQLLINEIQNLKFDKDFNLNILFQTKVNR